MEIRLANIEDVPVVHRVMREAFEEYRDLEVPSSALTEPLEKVERLFRNGTEKGAICVVDGEAAGSVRFQLKSQSLYFSRLSVLPAARGKGLAKAMLVWLEKYALEQGKERMECLVRATLPENIKLYHSIGYEITEKEEVFNPNGHSVQVVAMEKRLFGYKGE